MIDPNDERGIKREEMKTPEQRERETQEFAEVCEPIIGRFYPEGEIVFGESHENAMSHVTRRIFAEVEKEELDVNLGFLREAQSVLDQINSVGKTKYSLGETSLRVLRHYLWQGTAKEADVDLASVAFLADEMKKFYAKATGHSLSEWAENYNRENEEQEINFGDLDKLFTIYDRDFEAYRYNLPKLTTRFAEFVRANGAGVLDPQQAMRMLHESGFFVPAEWKEEYASTPDGQTLLGGIKLAERKIAEEDMTDALVVSLETRPREELQSGPLTANDVIELLSLETGNSVFWEELDTEEQESVARIMKAASQKLGAVVKKVKKMPVITYLEN
ncbi:MAG: hypothetical protein WC080_04335 [Patescibacteria group bacterium]